MPCFEEKLTVLCSHWVDGSVQMGMIFPGPSGPCHLSCCWVKSFFHPDIISLTFQSVPCFPFSVSNRSFARPVPAVILALTLESRLVAKGGHEHGVWGGGEELVMWFLDASLAFPAGGRGIGWVAASLFSWMDQSWWETGIPGNCCCCQ